MGGREGARDDSYRIAYPDGASLTWYRMFKLDGRWIDDVLLVPVPDDNDWALFDGVPEYTRKDGAARR